MEEIKITQTDKGFFVEQGNKQAEMLSWNEMVGTIAALTMPNPNLCLQWMKKKEKPYTPKDGDFVTYKYESGTYIAICSDSYDRYYVSFQIKGSLNAEPHYDLQFLKGYIERRLATEEEKNILLDTLKHDGLIWNTEKKKIEKWKPKHREEYWYFNGVGKVNKACWVEGSDVDNSRYEIGNCFRTKAEAQAMSDKFKELLKQ